MSFPESFKALVVGSSGAIGGAFVQQLQQHPSCAAVHTLSRTEHPGFDITHEASIAEHIQALAPHGPFHLVVDATGALTINGKGPEKALNQVAADTLQQSFLINATGPVVLMRHVAPLMAQGPTWYVKLSARVGSISDNQKGGWYAYRAAKAALNQFLQTAAIELQRRRPELRVVAMQPGTVRSKLSELFQAGVPHLLEPHESVAGMMQALQSLQPKVGAHYVDWQGQEIAW
jgi:NAD(P)-dependent dehydrogenase (short-subunit alcohol dehydrogenase family)